MVTQHRGHPRPHLRGRDTETERVRQIESELGNISTLIDISMAELLRPRGRHRLLTPSETAAQPQVKAGVRADVRAEIKAETKAGVRSTHEVMSAVEPKTEPTPEPVTKTEPSPENKPRAAAKPEPIELPRAARRKLRARKNSRRLNIIAIVGAAVALVVLTVLLLAKMLLPEERAPEAESLDSSATSIPTRTSSVTPSINPTEEPIQTQLTGSEVPNGATSPDTPDTGNGQLVTVPGTWKGSGIGRVLRYQVRVEEGVPLDAQVAARSIHSVLNDPRGWGGDGSVSFERTDGAADFQIVIVTPATTDKLCWPLNTRGHDNCRVGTNVVLNARRWITGSEMWPELGKTMDDYRIYEINHETGHFLGHDHEYCAGVGKLAPVMKQQSSDSGDKNDGCVPNGWPFPKNQLR